MRRDHRWYAFSLIELTAVLAVVAILAAIGLYAGATAQSTARDEQRKAISAKIVSNIDAFFRDNGFYPSHQYDVAWTSNQLTIGPRTIPLTGALSYSNTTTNATVTRYFYQSASVGYVLCVGRESGGWIRTGFANINCP